MKQVIGLILLCATVCFGQEFAVYESVEYSQVGFNPAPFEKWGAAFGDLDKNGWPDIFILRWKSPGHSQVYLNQDGVFTEITDNTPLEEIETEELQTASVTCVDYDNDGDQDIYFGTDLHMHLLRNDGNSFVDVAADVGLTAGMPGFVTEYKFRIGIWADYDLDGDLDLVVGQQNNKNVLFYKNEQGQFTDVADQVGVANAAYQPGEYDYPEGTRGTRHMQWVDYDLDGDPDLNVGGYLYRNDDGYFTNVSEQLGFSPTQIQNADWFDYDNDGDLDYYKNVVSPTAASTNELWENRDGSFVDVSLETGVGLRDRYQGLSIGDYENDGDQDIFIQLNTYTAKELLLLNDETSPGVWAFADIAEFIGLEVTGDRKGGGFLDYNMDGFLDIYIPSAGQSHILYKNLTTSNNWVGCILEGTESNKDAIGTLVKIVTGTKTQIRYTKSPTGWLSQDNPFVHFGVGTATVIDSLIIRWPLGKTEVYTNVDINQYHKFKEGINVAVESDDSKTVIPEKFKLSQNYPNPFNPTTTLTYSLPETEYVKLNIYNMNGQIISELVNEIQTPGTYFLNWDATDKQGKSVSAGVYFYKIETETFSDVKKMVLVK